MPYVEQLFNCVELGELRVLIDHLSRDPSAVNACDETGQTVLQYACALGQVDIVIHLLNRHDCQIMQQDQLYGYTALHVACLYNQQKVVGQLLKKFDADGINTQDLLGWTALHHAARNGNLEICKALVNHECRPEAANYASKTACHYAAEHGHLGVVDYLYDFVERDIKPKISVKPEVYNAPTLLHSAALNDCSAMVEWLKKKSYPPNNKWKRTVDYDGNKSRQEYPEDVAAARGYISLRGTLSAYRLRYLGWIRDISTETATLDRIKLCICGHPRVGKSAMCESLGKPYLQAILRSDVQITQEVDVERHTFGIDITSVQLSGKDLFSVWDFAGQVNSFITHQFFISTESTVFAVLVNLTMSLEEQREELLWWLGFIKTRNLGQVPFFPGKAEEGAVPMLVTHREYCRMLPVREWMKKSGTLPNRGSSGHGSESDGTLPKRGSHGSESDGTLPKQGSQSSESNGHAWEETSQSSSDSNGQDMYGSYLEPVPVIVIGSHYDLIPAREQEAVVARTQRLLDEVRSRFEEYLEVSEVLYPLNCLKAVSPEMKALKERLCTVRSKLLEIQPRYPQVMEQVARKVEALRVEQPKLKVVLWEAMVTMVHEEVNKLLTERQLSYIFKCLANAGVLVYFNQGTLGNYVFIDPAWLCRDVLGKSLAPQTFPAARITPVGAVNITEDVLQARFAEHIDKQHIPIILELLQQFELCSRVKEDHTYHFPSFITEPLTPDQWKSEPDRFIAYIGRLFVCLEESDAFPPGFFSRLQVQASESIKLAQLSHFKGSFVADAGAHQCLVQINSSSTAIHIIGRITAGQSNACIQLMDAIQTMVALLVRTACPSIFLNLKVFSSSDLKAHAKEPHCYRVSDVVAAHTSNSKVVNAVTGVSESPVDLMFLGDERLQKHNQGRNTKLAYLPEEMVEKVQELLEDGEKNWRHLARELGLGKYVQLLESRAPHSTRLLLLKWGEKSRWTVDSLLYALKQLGRIDAYNFIRSRVD